METGRKRTLYWLREVLKFVNAWITRKTRQQNLKSNLFFLEIHGGRQEYLERVHEDFNERTYVAGCCCDMDGQGTGVNNKCSFLQNLFCFIQNFSLYFEDLIILIIIAYNIFFWTKEK